MTEVRSSLSTEYLKITITADVILDTQPVAFAFKAVGAEPTAPDWVNAAWIGSAGTTRTARLLVGPGAGGHSLVDGLYVVWYRITDNPEVPARQAGRLKIT